MKIICVACPEGTEVKEAEYPAHMATVHGGSQMGSIMNKRNVPKTSPIDLPPGIKPGDLPSVAPTAEFLQTVAEMEKEASKPQTIHTPQPTKPQVVLDQSPLRPVADKKPIELTYQYVGKCPECNTNVNTIMVEVKDELHAIAWCLTHHQQKDMQVWKIGENNLLSKPLVDYILKPMVTLDRNNDKQTMFYCDVCPKYFPKKRGLEVHHWRVHKKGDEK